MRYKFHKMGLINAFCAFVAVGTILFRIHYEINILYSNSLTFELFLFLIIFCILLLSIGVILLFISIEHSNIKTSEVK